MARWRLTQSHYLNIPGNEWQQIETDRMTGRQLRKQYAVPRLLDVKDPNDWTNVIRNPRGEALEGEIIVCYQDKGEGHDIVFVGDPTPYMEPMDDEAREISGKFADKWDNKGEENYDNVLITRFEKQMALLLAQGQPQNAALGTASSDEIAELRTQMAEMMKQNTALIQHITQPKEAARRA